MADQTSLYEACSSSPTLSNGTRASVRSLAFLIVYVASLAQVLASENKNFKPNTSVWQTIRSKIRIRTFSEFMSPAIQNPEKAVPSPDGTSLIPTNIFNIAWIDYEFAHDYRIVYWQRFMVHLAPLDQTSTFSTVPRNPRIGLRRTQLINIPNLANTIDFYVEPGIAPEGKSAGRLLEIGTRINLAYTVPHSRWSLGTVIEGNIEAVQGPNMQAPFYGWLMPWLSYEIDSTFSTSHVAAINFMHQKGTRLTQLDWDLPMPYTQNGINIVLSKAASLTLFLNNYLQRVPTLKNTWASVWLSLEIL